MKGWFPRILPHLIAFVVFLVVATIYCSPVLSGKSLEQNDVAHWKSAIRESQEYKETHGEYPLWTNSLFSGMPAFQIGYPSNNHIPWWAHTILTLGLPKPIQFFFLACICFYFLSQVLRVNPYIGIFGALSFAYATYNPVIISVGHETKMWSIAYMPAVLASILLVYNRKYWIGGALTALFVSILIAMNHPQIAYYLFIAIGVMTIFFIVRWIRARELKHLGFALAITVIAGVIGLLTNAVNIMSTYEYQKETIRGGYSELAPASPQDEKSGLRKDYAFEYSLGIAEPLVMLVPRMFGGSSDKNEVGEKSKVGEFLSSQGQAPGELGGFYWGDIGGVGTSGPPYVGAVVCFLAILGMFVLENKHKWWMFTTIILTIMMSWGHYFEDFNLLFYKYLPLYNKFRAPSMIMVIPQLLLPTLAIMALHKIAYEDNRDELWKRIKKGLLATAALFALLFILYLSFDFISEDEKRTLTEIQQTKPEQFQGYSAFFEAYKEDRQALMRNDIFRSLMFIGFAFLLVYLVYKRSLNRYLAFGAVALLSLIDLLAVDSTYLNYKSYKEPSIQSTGDIPLSAADEPLQADKSFYRVFNQSGNAFSENFTSYHYNSVGGYHPAKLRLYNDLIDSQLRKMNMAVYNMLNTKYVIQKDRDGITTAAAQNPGALGNAWFIKAISLVPNASQEMRALDQFNPRDTAIMQENVRAKLGNLPLAYSGSGTITLEKNDNDLITYNSTTATNEFAVFSEIYYEAGWKAFIDNREVPIARVNYALRGIAVPAGNHKIVFRFEPQGYLTGRSLTTIFSILMLVLLAAGIFFTWREERSRKTV